MSRKVSNTLKIIKVLYKLGGCATIDELMSNLSLDRNYIHSYLSILRDKGVITNKIVDDVTLYCLNLDDIHT